MTDWTRRCYECGQNRTEPMPHDAQIVYDACVKLHEQGAKITVETVRMITGFGDDGWLGSLSALGLLVRLPGAKPTEYTMKGGT